MGLFRQEAIDQQKNRLFGDVLLSHPMSYSVILLLIVSFFLVSIIFLSVSHYVNKQTVKGYLRPTSGLARVFTQEPGEVIKVYVKEGMKVKKDDALFLINSETVMEDGEHLEVALLNELKILEQQIASKKSRLDEQKKIKKLEIDKEKIFIDKEIDLLNNNKLRLDARLAIHKKKLSQAENLYSKNFISINDYNSVKENYLIIESSINDIQRSINNYKLRLDKETLNLQLFEIDFLDQVDALERDSSSLRERLANINSKRFNLIRAPRDGVVSSLQVEEGQYTQDGLLATLVPFADKIEAELLVPSEAIGFATIGQKVLLRYAAFPYQKFGLQKGAITNISEHIFLPEEMRNFPMATGTPAYKVQVTLDQQFILAYGRQYPLKAGMLLDADIQIGSRTLLEWFLEPLFSLKGRI